MEIRKVYDILMNIVRYPYLRLKHNSYSILTCSIRGGGYRSCNIGDYVYIGQNTTANYTDIGPYTCISSNVVIGGMEHTYSYYSINPKLNPYVRFGERTRIGCDVWIGANVVIRQGITIGDGAVIGAGSIVTHDVPENCIVYGTPARVVKNRFTVEQWKFIKDAHYYDCQLGEARRIIEDIQNKMG